MASPSPSVTQLLKAWGTGDDVAGNELIAIVYKELRRLAAHYLQAERSDHTLQPTALVHELYLKLFSGETVEWQNRGHFLAVSARQLRLIVVDYAKNRHALKRGGQRHKLSLEDAPESRVVIDERVLELDLALGRLEELDPRASKVVELRYFGGLTEGETAEALGISVPTVKRDWEFARTWLLKEIG